jgi:hypothetical protein
MKQKTKLKPVLKQDGLKKYAHSAVNQLKFRHIQS